LGSYPFWGSLFCWFRGTYCLSWLNLAQMYLAELGSGGGCFSVLNVINSPWRQIQQVLWNIGADLS
jgi:hypothetical protein